MSSQIVTRSAFGALLVLALGSAAGVALADDSPVIGSPECAPLVDADLDVRAAAGAVVDADAALGLLGAAGTAEEIADATAELDVARSTLAEVRARVELELCAAAPVEPVDPEPTTPTTPVTPDEPPQPATPEQDPGLVAPSTDLDVEVDPLDDDGTDLAPGQITIVPDGSVATGSA